MFNPKPEIVAKLKELGYPVLRSSSNVFTELPAITYRIDGNAPDYDLDNQITAQEVMVTIDIWTEESTTASTILAQVEAKMRELKYRLNNALDVDSPKGATYHINASFISLR